MFYMIWIIKVTELQNVHGSRVGMTKMCSMNTFFVGKWVLKHKTCNILTLASEGGGGGVDATPMSFSELDAKPFGVSR